MSLWTRPEWLLLAIPVLAAWWRLTRGGRARGAHLRGTTLAVLLLALAGPRLPGADRLAPVVVLADRSQSVGVEGLRRAAEVARASQGDRPVQVITFGEGAQRTGDAEGLEQLPLQDRSDLAAGLRLAAGLAGEHGADVLVVSDGVATEADPLGAVPDLLAAGARVFTVPIVDPRADAASIRHVSAPGRTAAGQPVDLGVQVEGEPGPARLELWSGDTPVAGWEVTLTGRPQTLLQSLVPPQPGLLDLQVVLHREGDALPENNRARLAIDVVGPPRVVVVGAPEGALVRALRSAGLDLQVEAPGWTAEPAGLLGVSAVVLENTPLSDLGDGSDRALAAWVQGFGGGLLVTGGARSFAAGGYFHSELEPLLPVVFERREQLQRPPMALAVVLDRSGSMGAPAGAGTKMDLANQGAAEALGLLTIGDEIAVLAVDTAAHVILPRTAVSGWDSRQGPREAILRVQPGGGGILLETALLAAVDQLLPSPAPTRHLLLLSDASDTEEPGAYEQIIRSWRQTGGTVTVVGLGSDTDPDAGLLRRLAELAEGEVFFTTDATRLPSLFAQDVMQLAQRTFLTGAHPALATPDLPPLGAATDSIPDVGGYNRSLPASGADVWLFTPGETDEPLAAAWQRGTGRVAALMFDVSGEHAGPIARWAPYRDLLRTAVEWVRRPEQAAALSADVELHGRRADVVLEVAPGQRWPRLPEVVLLGPDARPRQLDLRWAGPTRLEGSFPLDTHGTFTGAVAHEGRVISLPPVTLPRSPEHDPWLASRDGGPTLQRLAALTGGGPWLSPASLGAGPGRGRDATPWLAGLAVLLVLTDIALRRGLLDPALRRAAALAPRPAHRPPTPAPTEPTTAPAAPPVEPTAPPTPPRDPLAEARERAARRRR
jgi:Mg-chelatase subunit ChlD